MLSSLAIFKLAALQHFSPQHASIEPAPSSTLPRVRFSKLLGVGKGTGPVERNGTDYILGKENDDYAE
jgi:hypothetical protein